VPIEDLGDEFNIHAIELESRILELQPTGLASDAALCFAPYPVMLHTDTAVTHVGARNATTLTMSGCP